MQFAQGEIAELETKLGRDIGVGDLLARQIDIEADGPRPGVIRAPVGRLHDARPAAGYDDKITAAFVLNFLRNREGEFSRLVIIFDICPASAKFLLAGLQFSILGGFWQFGVQSRNLGLKLLF